jgi:2-succinyl-6-hydroxy-2,4-cyclohexadiene-1-carboxylate synthase
MSLACQIHSTNETGKPWLVFLHGLLGSGEDWQPVLPYCQQWPCMTIDLPGHGDSVSQITPNFEDTCVQLRETLQQQGIERYWLIGYSLGSRIAMYFAAQGGNLGLQGVIIEGGHPGLTEEAEREARLNHDSLWAERFRTFPLADTLEQWYQQPVFADLTAQQRQALVALRGRNSGKAIASMLMATSLSKQPFLWPILQKTALPLVWLCGEHDNKFQQLAQHFALPLRSIANAGHNAHRANPAGFASQLISFISSSR